MLADRLSAESLRRSLIPAAQWRPFPTRDERAFWEALPAPARQGAVAVAAASLGQPWPAIPAQRFLDFPANGNRSEFERLYFERRARLAHQVLAECLEGQGRFLGDVVDGIWATCEETYWGLSAHVGMQKAGSGLPDVEEPTVDLFAAETGALLAWSQYLLGPQLAAVSPLLPRRIAREIQHRILTPCLTRDDFGWMGFPDRIVNNWNPWINSNWLLCALLVEADPERRLAAVQKILRSLDIFVRHYPADGGCDEGPNYWGRAGASLFDCLDLLHRATAGAYDLFSEPLIAEMGRYIYRLHIANGWFVNFADAHALAAPEGLLVFRYGERIGDAAMQSFGAWLHRQQTPDKLLVRPHMHGFTRTLPNLQALGRLPESAAAPLPGYVYLPGLQVVTARDQAGSPQGFFLAAKGGHNDESHNHNDVGHFIVYLDGAPLLVDAGVETYTRFTFSPHRYRIWTMQSVYHNLPTINGQQQSPGRDFCARGVGSSDDGRNVRFSLDLAGAYPREAHVESWRRTLELQRGQAVELHDEYRLSHLSGDLQLHLVTPSPITPEGASGRYRLQAAELPRGNHSAAGLLSVLTPGWTGHVEPIALTDPQIRVPWGERLYRLTLTCTQPTLAGTLSLRLTRG